MKIKPHPMEKYRRVGPPPNGERSWTAYFEHARSIGMYSNLRIDGEAKTVAANPRSHDERVCPHCGHVAA